MKTIEEIKEIYEINGTLEDQEINELFEIIENLEKQIASRGKGRKQEVYEVLEKYGPISIKKIAEKLGISTKNVSSQLTYLKSDNIKIFTDDNGFKFIYKS